jgi:hypothetical protein
MIVALIILGFVALGVVIGFLSAASAPVGYEDEHGFHFGPEEHAARKESAAELSAAETRLIKAIS